MEAAKLLIVTSLLTQPFHRTETLDFGIVMKGQITLVLDNNEKQVCKPGDVIVQRGTIHAWHNETDEWARVYFVVLGRSFRCLRDHGAKRHCSDPAD